ncbi:MAG: hypothetical protein ABEH78_08010 [Haloferacaceae archaeon]
MSEELIQGAVAILLLFFAGSAALMIRAAGNGGDPTAIVDMVNELAVPVVLLAILIAGAGAILSAAQ